MKLQTLFAIALAPPLFAQISSDQHWLYDDFTDHRGEPFAMLSTNTHLYMGGLFLSAGGNVNEEDLTRFNYATESWEDVPGTIGDGIGGRVDEIFQDSTGSIFFGGNFSLVGGTDARHIARFNPTSGTWEALFDPSSNLTKSNWDNGPADGRVLAIARGGNSIFVGGEFTDASIPTNERFILQYELGTGNSVSTGIWRPVGTGTGARVDDLLVLPNGDLLAATRTASGLMLWNGSTWSDYAGGVDSSESGGGGESVSVNPGVVLSMALHPDGRIFVAGSFTTVGPSNLSARYVAAYDPAAGTWDTLNGGFGPDYEQSNGTTFVANGVFDIEIDSTGKVYVGGDIQSTVGGSMGDSNHVAVWDDTGSWKSLGSGLGSTGSQIVNCLAVDDDDRVFFGGVFSRGWEPSRSASATTALWDGDEELTVIPAQPDVPELRIEDGMIVLYARQGSVTQFRVREKDSLPLSASDNEYGPFGYPRFGITRRELTPFNPSEPRLFFQMQLGL